MRISKWGRWLVVILCGMSVSADVVIEQGPSAKAVWLDDAGRLNYDVNERGDRLPDFSHVGYHSGDRALPVIPVRLRVSPVAGDCTDLIQDAIDEVGAMPTDEQGHRGAVLLTAGTYRVDGVLRIRAGGVVLRGEGSDPDGTMIVAAGYGEQRHKRTFIMVGNGRRAQVDEASKQPITDSYVPVGTKQFSVASADTFSAGDAIVLFRPSTRAWIHHIGCDRLKAKWQPVRGVRWVKEGDRQGLYYRRGGISGESRILKREDETWAEFKKRVPLSVDGRRFDRTVQWRPGTYDFFFERRIVAIEGNRITVDAPVVQAMAARFGGGAIFHYSTPGRVREAGIENLRLVSEFAAPVAGHPYGHPKFKTRSEKHAWHAIKLNRNSEHCWVRDVTANHFGWSVVSASGLRATVQDCVSLGHASRISGGRRYPFMIDGQLNLVQRCITFRGRHEFVTQARTAGPNVFVDCIGFNSKSGAGPHHRYSVGTLFDNVKSRRPMESRFRGNSGTGHGWAASQTCFYNCMAPRFAVQAPPGGISWVLGCTKSFDDEARLELASLYYQQLRERLGEAALNRLVSSEQLESIGRYVWVRHRLKSERENEKRHE